MSDLKERFEKLEKDFHETSVEAESKVSATTVVPREEEVKLVTSKASVEEVIVWRSVNKEKDEAITAKAKAKRKTNVIDKFVQTVQKMFPIAEVKASYKVTKVNDKLPVFLGFCSELIDKKSITLNIQTTNTIRLQVFNDKHSLKVGALWDVPLKDLEARYHVLKALYQLKSRLEDKKTNFHIRHNHERLDLSEMIGFEIVFKSYTTLQGALNEQTA